MRHLRLVGLLSAAVVVLAGCGASGPRVSVPLGRAITAEGVRVTAAPAPLGDPPPERGGSIPPAAREAQQAPAPGAAAASPSAALRRYARLYINWSAATLPRVERRLAALAIGPARLEAQQTLASKSAIAALAADHVDNHGTVVAITRGEGSERGHWIIVTRERTSGRGPYAGLPSTLHVTTAAITNLGHGFSVSQWTPVL